MNKCFEKVVLNLDPDSDLDEDNGESSVAYRPIDKFVCNLPALIGSDKWKEKWHCGLVESDDESSSSDTDNNYSEDSPSISSKMDIEQTSSINQDNLSNILIKSVEPQEKLNDYYEQPTATIGRPNNGLFDISDDEESLLPPKSSITKIVDIPSTSFFREQVPQRKLVNLFDDQPPELPPNEPEDSDHDLFDTTIATSKKDITKQPVDLFNDNEFDSYIKNMETSQKKTNLNEDPPLKEPTVIVKKPLPKITNLFDDEVETDYFDEIMKNKTITSATTKLPAKPVVAEIIKPVKKLPVVAKTSKISNLFSDDSPDDDFDDLFAKKAVEIKKKNIFDEKEAPVKHKKPIDVFDNKSTVDNAVIPSFDDDSTVDNVIIPSFDNGSTVDTVIIPSLNEEPPEIDWETEENYDDPFENISVAIEKVSESNISFSSIPMFDDLPPDDDFDSKKSAQMENSSIFLDDDDDEESDMAPSFSITNEVINDEPPPLSGDETDRSISVKDKLNKFNSIEKGSGLEVKKVLPKKLNTSKFNINVNALLPGSRPPPPTQTVKADEPILSESSEEQIDQKIVESESKQENPIKSNILDNNLTKSRVRNVKKRPSTRHGREALYKKNLSDEKILDSTKNIESKETIKSPEQNPQSFLNDNVDDKEDDLFAAVLEKSVPIKEKTNALFDEEPETSVVEIAQASVGDVLKVNKTFTTNKISMFYDDKNDVIQTIRKIKEDERNQTIVKSLQDDKVFKKVNVKLAPKAKVYVESTSDDDLFGPSNVQEHVQEKSIKNTIDEDLFGSSSRKPFKPVNNQKSNLNEKPDKPKHKILSLFDDDFDDCDDLFSSSKTNVVTPKKVTAKAESLFDDDSDIFSKTKSISVQKIEKPAKPKVSTKSLFDDSEDDDLFNTKSNMTSKVATSSVKTVNKVIDNPLNI